MKELPDKKEEEVIISETLKFQAAWNRSDPAAIASFFVEDCRRVGSFGETQNNRAEVEQAYKMLLKDALPGSKVLQERGIVRFLSADMVVWQAGFEITNPGNRPSLKGYLVQVMKKENGRWLILEMHPKIFPT